jgi:F0F1-type ATP synthase assembly protein I
MWYNDAEQYVLWVIVTACGWFLVLKLNKAKPRWRAVLLLIIGFGAGYILALKRLRKAISICRLGCWRSNCMSYGVCQYNKS